MYNSNPFTKMLASGILLTATLTATNAGSSNIVNNLDAQTLLQTADSIRNPDGTFSVNIELKEYRNRKLTATSSLTVYSRPDEVSGQYDSLLRFNKPFRDADKLMLRNGKDLWFFDPDSKVSIRISPRARLIGQASNGDVMAANFAKDYNAELIGVENVIDASRKTRKTAHLFLNAKRSDVVYPKIDYWVDLSSGQPVKAEFRTSEKRLLKTAFFRRYEITLGKNRPTETIIIDGVNPNWVTVMRATNYAVVDVPKRWLHRAFLPRFLSEVK